MKPETYLRFLFCLCLVLLVSCSQNNLTDPNTSVESTSTLIDANKEEFFTKMFPIKEMNTKIRFWPEPETFKAGQCPDLALENLSRQKIIFPSGYGLRILAYVDDQWKDIVNIAQYVPPGHPQVSPKGTDLPGVISFPLCPDLDNFTLPIEIRILVTGEAESVNNTASAPVGAFIDIVIEK